ncbi:hypothetical protein SOVF_117940 [Spinacia oleracea]|uniref:RanBP2-type domain-containing protein n=1 Tax=Spinacia oleracea TaxID=3562 RepID=A0A9R0JKS8_SPIOL|nr:uncharacterized protein LOC110778153 [Spinacia oleracea]KNA13306.1 hypothetical protein SOVF_117940 [Spinacia oleracea]
MAPSSFSLLLRHFSKHHHLHLRHHQHYRHFTSPLIRHFSHSTPPHSSTEPPKPSSLSSRLSFVFEKIDEIEKERAEKDDALQRIRAWRESKKKNKESDDGSVNNLENEKLGLGFSGTGTDGGEEIRNLDGDVDVAAVGGLEEGKKVGLMKKEIELAHPWPEWVALMERLVHQNYFDHRRKDEDQMIECLGSIDVPGFAEEEGFDFTRDWKTVHAAIINFGKDRFDLLRSLSRQDIQAFVGYGCPSTDKKVVFSAKLLRKHAHLDEGDVCSSCSLRTKCERAYLVTNKEDEARTIDVMRVILTYGFDPINGSVENKSLLKHKSVKTVVRKLLHEVVRLSAVPIDPNLPPPVIKKRPPKVKQPPPPPKRRVGRDDVEMKKGDWLCPKCNFMNFAKNSVCLQCDAKRPKRQLLPGEWECPQCNFLNYRRNMTCFNCEHKRPPDEYTETQMQSRQERPVTRLERAPDREQLSNAWNFDFDDDESDGADVAAFEYADARAMNEDHHLDNPPENGTYSRPQENQSGSSRTPRFQEKESPMPMPMQAKHSMGFDDFDDEDDDIDSYELDNQNRNQKQEAPSLRFSDVENEGYSDAEGDDENPGYSRRRSSSYPESPRSLHQQGSVSDSGDDDSDKDLPVNPKWRSSHVAGSGQRNKASRGSSKKMSFDSDEDDDRLVFGSDDDIEEGFTSRQRRANHYDSDERDLGRGKQSNQNRKRSGFDGSFVKDNDFDDDYGRSRGSHGSHRDSFDNVRGRLSMRGGSRGSQRDSFDNERGDSSMRGGSRGRQRDSFENEYEDSSMSEGSRGRQRGSFDNYRGRGGSSMRGGPRGSQWDSFEDERGRGGSSMRGGPRGSRRDSFDSERGRGGSNLRGGPRGSRRDSFDSERGHGGWSMRGGPRGSQRDSFDNDRGSGGSSTRGGNRGSQRGSFDNGRGRRGSRTSSGYGR